MQGEPVFVCVCVYRLVRSVLRLLYIHAGDAGCPSQPPPFGRQAQLLPRVIDMMRSLFVIICAYGLQGCWLKVVAHACAKCACVCKVYSVLRDSCSYAGAFPKRERYQPPLGKPPQVHRPLQANLSSICLCIASLGLLRRSKEMATKRAKPSCCLVGAQAKPSSSRSPTAIAAKPGRRPSDAKPSCCPE